ncbi:TetR family transcriptional regulator [Actinorhabdospora filicis]|uniref:TetR family transcriptional regulator n=1 Tax=Actinorhabdospora filicis TaxID=1785913 RepID=A0A9W6WCE9_9ACTN|nr:TetR family transcriptional regulator [Actinorhabdospora filicis]GLZ81574.1 TetR family transcriptional regulator [Actinorhabdospora filicis]
METPSLTARMRLLVTGELTGAALRLMAADGFDAVTVDQIAATAGVSRRTFFRHFASKEDVVVRLLTDMGGDMAATLAARPESEPPSLALRHAVTAPIAACAGHAGDALPVVRLVLTTPALLARFLERVSAWQDELTAALAARAGLGADDLRPRLAAGTALSAFGTVLHRWVASEGAEDPLALTEAAFTVIGPVLDAVRR